MKMSKKLSILRNNRGFTLLEILMVLLLVAILAAVGVTAYINYTKDAKNAATKANLQILRNGIAAQFANAQLHCSDGQGYWPCVSMINANDITHTATEATCPLVAAAYAPSGGVTGQICTTSQVTSTGDRLFIGSGAQIPVNPWGQLVVGTGNLVVDCEAGTPANGCQIGAAAPIDSCNGSTAWSLNATDGWCYDSKTGQIWANSANNGGAAPGGYEYSF
jgi:prepilin-type N-terminal cleavage/methylation domain-containing protein